MLEEFLAKQIMVKMQSIKVLTAAIKKKIYKGMVIRMTNSKEK